jgi:hypothetical protein
MGNSDVIGCINGLYDVVWWIRVFVINSIGFVILYDEIARRTIL